MAQPPVIDRRTVADVVRQITGDPLTGAWGLREVYTPEWTSRDSAEPGNALAQLFARLMEIILDRLNRVPEKAFVAFLDILGIDRLPGNSSRTPVKFLLPAGNVDGGFVAEGSQLQSKPGPSGAVHVFETDVGFFATPAVLKAIIALVPSFDLWTDFSSAANASAPTGTSLTGAGSLIEHSLYIADDTILGTTEPAILTIDVQVAQNHPAFQPPLQWLVVWERFSVDSAGKGSWVPIEPDFESVPSFASQFLESGKFSFSGFSGTARSVQGAFGEANWIRARLATPLTAAVVGVGLPQLQSLRLGLAIDRVAVPFVAAFNNGASLDLSKDFLPFGAQPRLGDVFYLASNEAFSKPGALIILQPALSQGVTVGPSPDLQLRWEAWDGTAWQNILIVDNSTGFSVAAPVMLRLPLSVAPVVVNGLSAFWIRVRIAAGNYGLPARYRPKAGTISPVEFEFVPDTFAPPSLSSLTLSYEVAHPEELPQKAAGLNSFVFTDRLPALRGVGPPFAVFEPGTETDSTLYLGFDSSFGDNSVSFYIDIQDPPDLTFTAPQVPPQVTWEYSTAAGWNRLELLADETNQLSESGTFSFNGPRDFAKALEFGRPLFWLRARFASHPDALLLRGVHTNTVEASNHITIRNELLGSGNGQAGQTMTFSQRPVLPGEQVYVREVERPSAEVIETLAALETGLLGRPVTDVEKTDIVKEITNTATGAVEVWVRWFQTANFVNSDAQGRQYVLDRVSGVLTFGDSVHGLLPPLDLNNVQAYFYQAGGGLLASQEVTAGTLTDLQSALPFVDSVVNLADAAGGSDPETVDDVLLRGPQTIKNRDRAVTTEDYVWLARQASTLVHNAKCLPTRNASLAFEPGAVTVLIVPQGSDPRPRPSQQLIREVRKYLSERALSAIATNISVIPPLYHEVRVTADVVPVQPEEASVVEGRILEALNRFLHPVLGGPAGTGWDFGRSVYISEVSRILEGVEGVDVALSVTLNESPALTKVQIGDNELPVAGTHVITMLSSEE
jgi:hypothetical protein